MPYFTFLFLTYFLFNSSALNYIQIPTLTWEFVSIEDDMGTPQTTVYLLVDSKKHLVGKGIGNFSELGKNAFGESQYQIPKNAISACAGFWAGLGHQFCVIHKGNILEVKEGFLEAESPKGTKVKYKTVKKISIPD